MTTSGHKIQRGAIAINYVIRYNSRPMLEFAEPDPSFGMVEFFTAVSSCGVNIKEGEGC